MKAIIRAENIGKQYNIGARSASYATLRESFAGAVKAPFNWLRRNGGSPDQTIWALRDVSFEVQAGEVVGVIGRNGAGKSTLLKILSRITEPTTGQVDLFGRVGSLLEVGTGFHPELTGRENIYLNGAILGMRRAEIERKFDEMVAFAEVDQFIDTPVKRYSSGMYMRLAFAVAAHLDPEILLVDEVLAVGDPPFQKKCLGKMDDVARQGRTVLFVSHNMSAIGKLCPSAIYLDGGELVASGETQSVISKFVASYESAVGHREWPDVDSAPGDEFIRARSVGVFDVNGKAIDVLRQDRPFIIRIIYQVLKHMRNANVGFALKAEDGTTVFTAFDAGDKEWSGHGRDAGCYRAECVISPHLLNEGRYFLTLEAGIPFVKLCIRAHDVLLLEIGPSVSGLGPAGRIGVRLPGVVAPELVWKLERLGANDVVAQSPRESPSRVRHLRG